MSQLWTYALGSAGSHLGAGWFWLFPLTGSGWFAARPSVTEDIYEIYAESFRGADHLSRILAEAQAIVDAVLAAPIRRPEIASETELQGRR